MEGARHVNFDSDLYTFTWHVQAILGKTMTTACAMHKGAFVKIDGLEVTFPLRRLDLNPTAYISIQLTITTAI